MTKTLLEYDYIAALARMNTLERYKCLCVLHPQTVAVYLNEILALAAYSANAVCQLFTGSQFLPPERIDNTQPHIWNSLARKTGQPEGSIILPCAAYLQLVTLEHYTEHAAVILPQQ